MKPIKITVGGVELNGMLNDSPLAERVWRLLPYEEIGETWGEEVYFPVRLEAENTAPVDRVNVGDIAYWPDGPDLCIFFGRTPKSTDATPVTASPVTVIGTFECNRQDFHLIRRERHGIVVRVEPGRVEPETTDQAGPTEFATP
ncbi:MAG: cyclophilin-like fold protein [candidate division WOR-3 bacterium]